MSALIFVYNRDWTEYLLNLRKFQLPSITRKKPGYFPTHVAFFMYDPSY